MKFVLCASLVLLTASSVMGQAYDFNIDINSTAGSGAGVPPNTFGGAAGQPGVWMDVNSTTPTSSTSSAGRWWRSRRWPRW